ncbi:MAG: zinc-ribbon domain-containing protein [Deltaproteobacteria bacterium]|nr:zinc-ribbon domain-containing protein [Deltaproteobacteria bacterium]
MRIECPHCGYSKEIPKDRVPETARSAKCPNCGKRFPFSMADAKAPLPESSSRADVEASVSGSISSSTLSAASGERDTLIRKESASSPEGREEPVSERVEAIPTRQDVLPWDELEVAPSEHADLDEESETETSGSTPWEDSAQTNLLSSLFDTARQALLTPGSFFSQMNPEGTYGYPISFALLLSFVGFFFQFLWGILFNSDLIIRVLAALQLSPDTISAGVVVGTAVMVPVLMLALLAGLFIQSAILHICLLILRGANAPFLGTFKVMSYSSAASVFLIIPFLGSFVAFVWGLVLMVIGVSRVHSIGIGKSVLAILLPFILLIVLCIMLFLTFQILV